MRRSGIFTLAQGVISLGLLVLVFRNFDAEAFWRSMRGIPPWFYVASLAVLTLGQFVYALKWLLVLRGMGRPVAFARLVEEYFVAIFANNFLPTMIGGDVARVYYLGRDEGYAPVATSVVVDRVLGFWAMAALGMGLLWAVPVGASSFAFARHGLTAVFLVSALGLALGAVASLHGATVRLRRAGLVRAADALAAFRAAARPLRRRADVVVAAVLLVAVYFVLITAIYRSYFQLAGGGDIEVLPLMAVLIAIAVLSNLPVSLNGIGLREQLHYLLFGGLGLSKELAVGASIMVFSQFLVLSVAGWILWRRRRRLSPPAEARSVPAGPVAATLAVIYDAGCGFCIRALALLRRASPAGRFTFHDGNDQAAIAGAFPVLAGAATDEAMFVVAPNGEVFRGFFAVRRIVWATPRLRILLPFFYIPGASLVGPRLYARVARHRQRVGCATHERDLQPALGSDRIPS
jgi:glycosyltransferase 2 family protein